MAKIVITNSDGSTVKSNEFSLGGGGGEPVQLYRHDMTLELTNSGVTYGVFTRIYSKTATPYSSIIELIEGTADTSTILKNGYYIPISLIGFPDGIYTIPVLMSVLKNTGTLAFGVVCIDIRNLRKTSFNVISSAITITNDLVTQVL